jgi:outer membrane protein
MMTGKRILLDRILLYAVAVAVIVIGVHSFNNVANKKIAYVDIAKLTDGYKFKKDLEAASTKNLYKIKNAIDSLKMVRKITGGTQPKVDTMLYSAEHAFQQYYTESNSEITQKVWDRLNPLIEAYGKEKGFQLLIGANGAGTVLYGDAGNDVTENLAAYINTKYEKGN